ncbi:MAG: helix-turn-helix protein [Solirubrobacterales bacterium]|nr:helix-turn-helix protein [Solirubrobacterales bacterium]
MSGARSVDLTEPLLTAEDVGQMLGGIPAKTVRNYAREGRLPSVKIGRHVRFVRWRVEEAITAAADRGLRI